MSDRANPFEWSGGHPALDLVNTLDERPSRAPIENLATYRDLIRFAALAGLVDRRTAARLQRLDKPTSSHIAKRARKLREHLHDVLAAANAGGRRGNPISARSLPRSRRHMRPGRWSHRRHPDCSAAAGRLRWRAKFPCTPVCWPSKRLLVDEARKRIRKCGASDCDVYLPRHQQGPAPAMVQHGQLRKSRKAAAMALRAFVMIVGFSPRRRLEAGLVVVGGHTIVFRQIGRREFLVVSALSQ